eukprot:8888728-Alexandrium_andersonii.AAC.1
MYVEPRGRACQRACTSNCACTSAPGEMRFTASSRPSQRLSKSRVKPCKLAGRSWAARGLLAGHSLMSRELGFSIVGILALS